MKIFLKKINTQKYNNLFNDIQKRVSIHNFEVVDDSLQYRAYTSNFYILDACTEDGEVLYPSYSIVSKSCNFGNIDFEFAVQKPSGSDENKKWKNIIPQNGKKNHGTPLWMPKHPWFYFYVKIGSGKEPVMTEWNGLHTP